MHPGQLLPHAPYIAAVDRELGARGIPPGRLWTYGAAYPGQPPATTPAEQRLCALLEWDPSRCGPGMTWHWGVDTGWRCARTGRGGRRLASTTQTLWPPVYAAPAVLADVAQALIRGQRPVPCDQAGEWRGAAQVRDAVEKFRSAPPAH
ncbi:hypothetical protein [Streptomyces sp. NPDC047525]|uniref:hypothetical protein n=1 Tax=Streptomyces sp. NPDC047525 TaxID=3155264 RepID=UPI0033D910DE